MHQIVSLMPKRNACEWTPIKINKTILSYMIIYLYLKKEKKNGMYDYDILPSIT